MSFKSNIITFCLLLLGLFNHITHAQPIALQVITQHLHEGSSNGDFPIVTSTSDNGFLMLNFDNTIIRLNTIGNKLW